MGLQRGPEKESVEGPGTPVRAPSRIDCNWKDTGSVKKYLKERNPFEYEDDLCNLSDTSLNLV